MFFATDFCNVQNLAQAIRSTDAIKFYANKVRQWLLYYNFGLEDSSVTQLTSKLRGMTLKFLIL